MAFSKYLKLTHLTRSLHGGLGSTLGSIEKRQVQKSHDKKKRKLTYTWVLRLIFALNALKLNEVTAKLQQKSHLGSRYVLVLLSVSYNSCTRITVFSLDHFFFFVKLRYCEKATKFEKNLPLVMFKTTSERFFLIFVAFSENLNFNIIWNPIN